MPNLEAMSLEDLTDLIGALTNLQHAGLRLHREDMNPVFRLVPGEAMSLSVAAVMPEACAVHEELFASGPDVSPDPDRLADLIRQTMASPPAAHGADDAPPAAGHDAAGGVAEAPPEDTPELPACATSSPNGAGKGGGAAENTQPAADSILSGAAVLKPGAPFPPPASADLLYAYLDGLPMRDGWTPARDEELMRLACLGWGMNEIAQDMDLRADRVKARYDLLTGHHKDDYGRWVRRFPREDVLAALMNSLAPAGEGK